MQLIAITMKQMKGWSRGSERLLLTLTVMLSLSVSVWQPAEARDGDLDTTFGNGGITNILFGSEIGDSAGSTATAVALQPDGKIVAVGQDYQRVLVARFNADGSRDAGFGVDGTIISSVGDSYAADIAVQSDGKIIVLWSGDGRAFKLTRYNSDGTLDADFGINGTVTTDFGNSRPSTDQPSAMAIQSDGRIIVVGGTYETINLYDIYRFAIARYNSNGSLDTSFDTDGKVLTPASSDYFYRFAYDVLIQPDGKIVAAGVGYMDNISGYSVVRYNTDGSLDNSFGSGGMVVTGFSTGRLDCVSALQLQSDGKIVAVGNVGDVDFAVVRYNTNGSLDTSFGTGGKFISSLGPRYFMHSFGGAIQADGKILVSGAPSGRFGIARLTKDGRLDTSFGDGGKVAAPAGGAHAIVIQPDGKIVAAGGVPVGASGSFAVVRYANRNLLEVTMTGDTVDAGDGKTSLREAINAANALGIPQTITFNIPSADAGFDGTTYTIQVLSPLPIITANGTSIDGTTQSGFSSRPIIELDGQAAGAGANGLHINAANCEVYGLTVNGFAANGVWISGASANNNTVQGCYIGTNATGLNPQRNGVHGVLISGGTQNNTVGGTAAGSRNVISGNSQSGIAIEGTGTTGNKIQGNYIGTNAGGTAALANANGVTISGGAQSNTVGGTSATPGAAPGNLISGNTHNGVTVTGTATSGNLVQGNSIGTTLAGTVALANGDAGVALSGGAQNNKIGDRTSGAGNRIAFNSGDGVSVQDSTTLGNAVRGNTIFNNAKLGINLVDGTQNAAGVTPNDSGDADAGPNNLQNAPLLTSVINSSGTTTINGTLNSVASTTFAIDFYANASADPSGFGEGETSIASTNVTTDAAGNKTFSYNVLGSFSGAITATATRLSAGVATDTSEFSQAAIIGVPPTISGFTPGSGAVGTAVTITGTNLTGSSAVQFNGTGATFTVNSATQITTTVPAGATTGSISVTTPYGTGTSASSFTILLPPTISSFSPASGGTGTLVTITGTRLSGATAVKFNGVSATLISNSATQVQATVPSTATTGPLTVTTPGGTATSATHFTVVPAPAISSFTPASGQAGTTVTITGTAFTGATAVKFNGVSVATGGYTVNSSTQITATVPAAATTGLISVTTAAGTGTSTGAFTVLLPPVNDSFAKAIKLTGNAGSVNGSTVAATRETGEPDHADNPGGASVWYSWTAPGTGRVSFNTSGSSFDTLLAVYRGTGVAALTAVASDDDGGGDKTSSLTFNAVAATKYAIAIDGYNGEAGDLVLNWSLSVASSATIHWIKATGGSWNSAANWNPARVPLTSDYVAIDLAGGYSVTLDQPATIAGLSLGASGAPGNLQTLVIGSGKALTLNTASGITANGALNLSGGTLTSNGDLTINGRYDWSGGTFNGSGNTYVNDTGTLNISGLAVKSLVRQAISNHGTTTWTGAGNITAGSGAAFYNYNAFNVQNDATCIWDSLGANPSFFNFGTFTKVAGAGVTTFDDVAFSNLSGQVDIQSGSLRLLGGGTSYGNFNVGQAPSALRTAQKLNGAGEQTGSSTRAVAANALIEYGSDYQFDKSLSTFTGSGSVAVTRGVVTVGSGVNANNWELSSGIVTGARDLNVTGTARWTGGTMSGSGATNIAPSATLEISGAANKTWSGRALNNSGRVTWTGAGRITAGSGAIFNNRSGATFSAASGATLAASGIGSAPVFNNAGILNPGLAATPGTLNLAGSYTQAAGGSLNIEIGGTIAGSGFDQLNVTGAATLGGNLNVSFINGFVPGVGSTFRVMTYGSRTGTFARINVPAGLVIESTYNGTGLVLKVISGAFAPTNVSLNPGSGSSVIGGARTYSAKYSDANGIADIAEARLLINSSSNGANALHGLYVLATNKLYLRDNANTAWMGGFAPLSNNVISNGQGSLNCALTTVGGNGNTLTVNWNFTPATTFLGGKYIYMQVRDKTNRVDGWEQMGTVQVVANKAPINQSVTPSSGSSAAGLARTLTAKYFDENGSTDIAEARLLVNSTPTGAGALMGMYTSANNKLFLRDNTNGSWMGGFAPGSANVITNSQGSLNCATTTVSFGAQILTINWSFMPTASFTGTKNLYLLVRDRSNAVDSLEPLGTWTITSSTAARVETSSVRLSSATAFASSQSVNLTFTSALDVATAEDVKRYRVSVNGQEVALLRAGYSAANTSVTLVLPPGALQAGDQVSVQWDALVDTKDAIVTGQVGPLTAR